MIDPSSAIIAAIVDDDQRMLWSLENLLESAGYTVRLFAAAETLLESGQLAELDCLISDIDLPRIDGFELLRRARAARPELPVILITGHHAIGERPPPGSAGNCLLLMKPFDGQDLLAAVSEAVQRLRGRS
ncbi:MAG TPA: response regulator [Steroidobacteraceae bacterium]|nr:response regulator [Steroidobacteraceae bacterium]HUA23650.1 response regulator [Steroidobacteraceae bacterium]